ncbi:hypothetical protein BU23DRAFT_555035 [Bimuria novae-zelandiae CBS 107.79]|uniref:Uncharacterized protein n=1 Tax=Bimuria novae-zelandiae CBS 107.79 TaxID=1447943 RepID=A0A6A5V742_9PLEO|nr:hypothetical protein BU23DRAFT_555035 [Bimuria novae-zelandiae CBS 107.79]
MSRWSITLPACPVGHAKSPLSKSSIMGDIEQTSLPHYCASVYQSVPFATSTPYPAPLRSPPRWIVPPHIFEC